MRHLLVASALALALVRCDNENSRLTDICVTLQRCAGYVDEEVCSDALGEALGDQRLSSSAVARCAHCLGDHAPAGPDGDFLSPSGGKANASEPETCRDVLDRRRCDAACADVSYVLQVRTTPGMREDMCKTAAAFCGTRDAEQFCVTVTEASLQVAAAPREHESSSAFETQLAVDAEVDACRRCLVKPDKGELVAETRAASCQLLVDSCADACHNLRSVSPILTTARTVLDACHSEACFPSKDGDAVGDGGAGGNGGADGNGGAGGNDAPTPGSDDPCFDRVLTWLGGFNSDLPSGAGGAGGADAGGADAGGADAAGQGGAAGEANLRGAGGDSKGPQADPTSRQLELQECASCLDGKACETVQLDCEQACSGVPIGDGR